MLNQWAIKCAKSASFRLEHDNLPLYCHMMQTVGIRGIGCRLQRENHYFCFASCHLDKNSCRKEMFFGAHLREQILFIQEEKGIKDQISPSFSQESPGLAWVSDRQGELLWAGLQFCPRPDVIRWEHREYLHKKHNLVFHSTVQKAKLAGYQNINQCKNLFIDSSVGRGNLEPDFLVEGIWDGIPDVHLPALSWIKEAQMLLEERHAKRARILSCLVGMSIHHGRYKIFILEMQWHATISQ